MAEPTASDIATDLARARSEAAMDRTLMAWIRTSLAAIGFGFGLEKTLRAVGEASAMATAPSWHVRLVSATFVLLGTVCLIVALIQHWQWRKAIERKNFTFRAPWPLAEAVSVLVAAIGAFALFSIVF